MISVGHRHIRSMNYYYLKIGKGNSDANDWLAGRNPLRRPAAVIYFDELTDSDYRNGKGTSQPRNFWQRGQKKFHDETLMTVIHEGNVCLMKPVGKVRFLPKIKIEEWTTRPKAMPIKVLTRKKCEDVPAVLASMSVNQYLAQGTFRETNHWGNMKAIDCVLGRACNGGHWKLKENGPAQLLECLSSTELETLVAKLFEAHGCHVPAYRGGTMREIDLFAYNHSSSTISIGKLVVPANGSISIQVKSWSSSMKRPKTVDYLIGLDVVGAKAFDAAWLLQQVKARPAVTAWLRRSLNWLPIEYLKHFGL